MNKICLVSPGHIASNPRLVKEANSLLQVGYEVRVVAGDTADFVRPLDKALMLSVKWTCDRIGLGTRPAYVWHKLKQKLARVLFQLGFRNIYIAMWAHSLISDSLAQAAIAKPADLYIAHCLAALPAVAIAAQKHNAKFGFDAEDFHVGELVKIPENNLEIVIRDYIERTLLPQCCYLTASSPMIAEAYRNRYGVSIEPVLNVFPLSEARVKLKEFANKEPFLLYWFSQTIGGNRGLESIVEAMAQMKTSVELHLRGIPATGYADVLTQLAHEAIAFLDRLPLSELVKYTIHRSLKKILKKT